MILVCGRECLGRGRKGHCRSSAVRYRADTRHLQNVSAGKYQAQSRYKAAQSLQMAGGKNVSTVQTCRTMLPRISVGA